MEDHQIVDLYWERNEAAIAETQKKYGNYCHTIAYRILYNEQDAEECVNDTYARAWDAMPPHRPQRLSAFLGKITRNLALNRYEKTRTQKRGGQVALALEELQDCLSDESAGNIADEVVLKDAMNRFLRTLPEQNRRVFLRRYWYLDSVKEIAKVYGLSESNVKILLMRTRNALKAYLQKEGITL